MALVVEDGSGVSNANSLVSLVDAQAYIDDRELSVTLTEGLLLQAMDSFRDIRWKGRKMFLSYPSPWPRYGVYDEEGRLINTNEVPQGAIDAQVWMAYYIEAGDDPSAAPRPAVVSEKVDVLSVQYAHWRRNTEVTYAILPNVRRALYGLTRTSGGRLLDRA